ncbi:MAG: hypothetical protein NT121_03380 [Chloroflexi bacterium]|nr:hypothetical protein [Chloroflexota bacterium]
MSVQVSDPIKEAMALAQYIIMKHPRGFALLDADSGGKLLLLGTYEECLKYLEVNDPAYYHGLLNNDTEFLWKGEQL